MRAISRNVNGLLAARMRLLEFFMRFGDKALPIFAAAAKERVPA